MPAVTLAAAPAAVVTAVTLAAAPAAAVTRASCWTAASCALAWLSASCVALSAFCASRSCSAVAAAASAVSSAEAPPPPPPAASASSSGAREALSSSPTRRTFSSATVTAMFAFPAASFAFIHLMSSCVAACSHAAFAACSASFSTAQHTSCCRCASAARWDISSWNTSRWRFFSPPASISSNCWNFPSAMGYQSSPHRRAPPAVSTAPAAASPISCGAPAASVSASTLLPSPAGPTPEMFWFMR